MRPVLFVLPLMALTACATPQEQCLGAASREARINAQLIAETQANITRGFGVRREQRVVEAPGFCRGRTETGEAVRVRCNEVDVRNVQVPVALDLDAERAKLDSLLAQRDAIAARTNAAVAQCRVLYPE